MRVVLAGRAADRNRLRRQLEDAGFEIVTEADLAPSPEILAAEGIDAVVVASPDSRIRQLPAGGDQTWKPPAEELTPREREVLTLVAEGLSNKNIAATLGISDQTVKFHVAAIIAKLGASNRTDAVRRALRRGLVAV